MLNTDRVDAVVDGASPTDEQETELQRVLTFARVGTPSAPARLRHRVRELQQPRRWRRMPAWLPAAMAPALAVVALAAVVVVPSGPEGLPSGTGIPADLSSPSANTAQQSSGEKSSAARPEDAASGSVGQTEPAEPSDDTSRSSIEPGQARILPYPLPIPVAEPVRRTKVTSDVYVDGDKQLSDAMQGLWEQLRGTGGYARSLSFSRDSGEARIVVRVPSESLPALLAEVSRSGTLVAQSSRSEDLTGKLAAMDRDAAGLQERINELLPPNVYPAKPVEPFSGEDPAIVPVPTPETPKKLTPAQQRELDRLQTEMSSLLSRRQRLLDDARWVTVNYRLSTERPRSLQPTALEQAKDYAAVGLLGVLALAAVGIPVAVARSRRRHARSDSQEG